MKINFQTETLANGLRVFYLPKQETNAVTVMFAFKVGSRYETAKQNGLSHFLEHMFFKGTEKRPNSQAISQVLDTLGAEFNAFTSEEVTAYYVSTDKANFTIAFDVLTDMLYHSKFEAEEIAKEKGVICEEIKMYADNPMSHIYEISKLLAYGDTPLGRDIAGTSASVNAFERQDFLDYLERFYTPANTIVIIAGNGQVEDWQRAVAPLAELKSGAASQFEAQTTLTTEVLRHSPKPIDQVHLDLIVPGLKRTDPAMPILSILSNILGGTMSSRLFVEVREKAGLAYYVRSQIEDTHDIGILSLAAGVDPQKLPLAVKTIGQELDKLMDEPVSAEELSRAKQNIRGKMSLRLESSYALANYIASEAITHEKIEQPDQWLAKIEAVTATEVQDLAKQLLARGQRKLAMVGPVESATLESLHQSLN